MCIDGQLLDEQGNLQHNCSIIVVYNDGATIDIEVPWEYYRNKYKNKSDYYIYNVFMREYKKFVKAVNKYEGIISVGKYLKFSFAGVSTFNVLCVTIVDKDGCDDDLKIAPSKEQLVLSLNGTTIDTVLDRISESSIISNTDLLLKKLLTIVENRSDKIEASTKSKKSKKTTLLE